MKTVFLILGLLFAAFFATAADTRTCSLATAADGAFTLTCSSSGNVQPPPPPPPPPPVPVSTSCPTGFVTPSGMLTANLGGPGSVLMQMQASNQVVSIPLPDTQPGYSSAQVAFGESAGGAYTPQPVTLNISISKCPGLIDTDYANRCNVVNTNSAYNAITWFAQPFSIISDGASANARGYCWAPKSEGPWYVNARWTYSSCAFGAATCGFAIQQNYGPY